MQNTEICGLFIAQNLGIYTKDRMSSTNENSFFFAFAH